VTVNYAGNFRNGKGPHVVVEGDEYDTAYFDKGPKFLHYRARTAILTSVEFDHADIYRDMAHYESAYEKFAATLPEDGFLAVASSYPNAVKIAQRASRAYVATYAAHGDADYSAENLRFGPEGARFVVREPRGRTGEFLLPMSGHHNVENALGVYAAARALGLKADDIRAGFASFAGVKRRQEIRGTVNDVLVIDDFAHHPTAIRETLRALRHRYPGARIWAVFEPRSNTTRRAVFQQELPDALKLADGVFISQIARLDQIPEKERLDPQAVMESIAASGRPAFYEPDAAHIIEKLVPLLKEKDVVAIFSNGGFEGIHGKLLERLKASSL
jgi:UDP-N-acetylmuramate: L-alanyl-gamma-D-glutamyl-meso-diaminopimelate ligase